MRRTLVTAGSFVLLLGAATTSASAHQGTGDDRGRSDDRAVILGDLDHPGQLSWDDDTLLVTEAGSGGNCTAPTTATGSTSARATSDDGTADQGSGDVPATPTTGTATPTTGTATPTDGATGTATDATEVCSGTTGSVIAVKQSDRGRGRAAPVADNLPSTLLSDGSVLGPTGAATGEGGVLLVAVGDRTPAAGSSGADPGADLLVVRPGKGITSVRLAEQPTSSSDDGTADQGPGDVPATPTTGTTTPTTTATTTTTQPTVVPNAVMVVDPTPGGRKGDSYALVTDAGARTVWKLTPDSSAGGDGSPKFTVTVFARYDGTTAGAGDFVPTTLTRDDGGTVFVGDGGSTAAAGASVIRYRDRGAEPAEEIDRWDGFTALTGLAASRNGDYLYVSQRLGASGGSGDAGSIVRVDTRHDRYTSADFAAPAGLAVGRGNQVFVASHGSTGGDQVTRISYNGSAPEQALPVTGASAAPGTPTTPTTSATATGTSAPATGTSDDGTADQGHGDAAGTTP